MGMPQLVSTARRSVVVIFLFGTHSILVLRGGRSYASVDAGEDNPLEDSLDVSLEVAPRVA